MYVIGIDGGGTKTKGVIADQTGHVAAEAVVGATNPNGVPAAQVTEAFRELFSLLMNKSGIQITDVNHVFAGLSGVSRPADQEQMRNLLISLLDEKCDVHVDNDAVTALFSGTLGRPGIVQISGTGSITYGINYEGIHNRVGGWGHFIDEKGSGFSIGRDALSAAFRGHDGMTGDTVLQTFLLDHFGESSMPDLIPRIYQSDNVKMEIAALAKLVFAGADQNDEASRGIVHQHACAIGESISCLIHKHFSKRENQPIQTVLAGGVFNRSDLFQETIEHTIGRHGRDVQVILPKVEPVAGAVAAALRAENIAIDENTFVNNYNLTRKGLS